MADPHIQSELTQFDKISVVLYRLGISLMSLSMVSGGLFFLFSQKPTHLLENRFTSIVFILFFVSVGMSSFFLHLYVRSILRVIQSSFVISLIVVLAIQWTQDQSYLIFLLQEKGLVGKISTIGFGFLLFASSAIAAKEAFCFKLKEGYIYALLTMGLFFPLFFFMPQNLKLILTIYIINALMLSLLTIRKLIMPLHYDIGDKSKYQD